MSEWPFLKCQLSKKKSCNINVWITRHYSVHGKISKKNAFMHSKQGKRLQNIVVVVVLLFYVHNKQLSSCQDGQLT